MVVFLAFPHRMTLGYDPGVGVGAVNQLTLLGGVTCHLSQLRIGTKGSSAKGRERNVLYTFSPGSNLYTS